MFASSSSIYYLNSLVKDVAQFHVSLDDLLVHDVLCEVSEPSLDGFSVKHQVLSVSIHVGHQLNRNLVVV